MDLNVFWALASVVDVVIVFAFIVAGRKLIEHQYRAAGIGLITLCLLLLCMSSTLIATSFV